MLTEQLACINNYSVDLIDRRLHKKLKPFIFSNSITQWPAFMKWNIAFFRQKYGNLEVTINYNLPDNVSPYLHDAGMYTKKMRLSDFLDQMPNEKKGCYLAQSEINVFDNLEEDFTFEELIPVKDHDSKKYNYVWIGRNTRSGLHYDFEDNFLVQINGVKKVFLVDPKYAQYVYPLPENFLKSQVNPMNPDFEKHPMFKHVTILQGELKPGDVLFIPRGWYHYIYSPQESISLNCWYGASLSLKDMFVSFYKSGVKIWLSFFRDFFWYGLFAKLPKERLYCSPPVGKLTYDWLVEKVTRLFSKA